MCVNFCLFCFSRGKGCCSEVLEIRHRAVFFFFFLTKLSGEGWELAIPHFKLLLACSVFYLLSLALIPGQFTHRFA